MATTAVPTAAPTPTDSIYEADSAARARLPNKPFSRSSINGPREQHKRISLAFRCDGDATIYGPLLS